MVLSAVFVVSISAFAQSAEGEATATVNPGVEPMSGSGSSTVEGNTTGRGVAVYCETCPNHVKYIKLGDNTNQANDYSALKPVGQPDGTTPAVRKGTK